MDYRVKLILKNFYADNLTMSQTNIINQTNYQIINELQQTINELQQTIKEQQSTIKKLKKQSKNQYKLITKYKEFYSEETFPGELEYESAITIQNWWRTFYINVYIPKTQCEFCEEWFPNTRIEKCEFVLNKPKASKIRIGMCCTHKHCKAKREEKLNKRKETQSFGNVGLAYGEEPGFKFETEYLMRFTKEQLKKLYSINNLKLTNFSKAKKSIIVENIIKNQHRFTIIPE